MNHPVWRLDVIVWNWQRELYCSRTQLRQNLFSNRVINMWNSLPQEVAMTSTVKCFDRHSVDNRYSMECEIRATCMWKLRMTTSIINEDMILMTPKRPPQTPVQLVNTWRSVTFLLVAAFSPSPREVKLLKVLKIVDMPFAGRVEDVCCGRLCIVGRQTSALVSWFIHISVQTRLIRLPLRAMTCTDWLVATTGLVNRVHATTHTPATSTVNASVRSVMIMMTTTTTTT